MLNPIYLKTGTDKKLCMFRDFVRSVTDRDTYNSVSFLKDTNIRGPKAPLISVMCFENDEDYTNFKKLSEHTKGRFVTIFAEERFYNGKKSYKAIGISIAPSTIKEETNPIDDSEAQFDFEEEAEEVEEDLSSLLEKHGLTYADIFAEE